MRRLAATILFSRDGLGRNDKRHSRLSTGWAKKKVLEMSDHPITTFLTWASNLSVIGTLMGIMPSIVTVLAAIWYCVLLYDRFIAKKRRLTK